jgi:hypothetical protein
MKSHLNCSKLILVSALMFSGTVFAQTQSPNLSPYSIGCKQSDSRVVLVAENRTTGQVATSTRCGTLQVNVGDEVVFSWSTYQGVSGPKTSKTAEQQLYFQNISQTAQFFWNLLSPQQDTCTYPPYTSAWPAVGTSWGTDGKNGFRATALACQSGSTYVLVYRPYDLYGQMIGEDALVNIQVI